MAKRTKKESQSEEFNESEALDANGQGELPEMPPSSPAGKAGRAYIRVKTEMEEAVAEFKDRKGKAANNLIEEMKKLGKGSILVDGYNLTHRHDEKDKIAVKAPRTDD